MGPGRAGVAARLERDVHLHPQPRACARQPAGRGRSRARRSEAGRWARKGTRRSRVRRQFPQRKKQSHPVTIDLIRDLTERLPENTALQRLSINRGEVQIQGVSSEASALITILQKSALIEGPALQGAITPDQRTQKEQFMIQARARAKAVEGADAAPAQG
ncbi:MAG: PilN domain-containing protein [Xanthomonadales bacterium]|nr:PilN domain-containing protein [Xanthomonadales bacterium]